MKQFIKKSILIGILFLSNLYGYNPVVLTEVIDNNNTDSYFGLGYKAIESFEKIHKKRIPIFSSEGSKYNKEELIRKIAKDGYNPIVLLGSLYSKPLEKVAKEFQNQTFIMIDGNSKNVKNILNLSFKEEEGAFLVGTIAAMKSKSNIIGFVGGMDIPVIRRYACGFIQGVKYINSNAKILLEMTGNTYKAFNNPKKGEKIATKMIKKGADIIFQAADRTGKGVIKAAQKHKAFAIGVDYNQNGEAPGTVLTSMLKRVDVAIYKVLLDSMNGQLIKDDKRYGLKDEEIGWSLDKYNIHLITKDLQEKIDTIEFEVVQEMIKIEDYMQKNSCSYYNFN